MANMPNDVRRPLTGRRGRGVSMSRKHYDPQKFQKRFAAVVAIVVCLSLILSLVAGLLVY